MEGVFTDCNGVSACVLIDLADLAVWLETRKAMVQLYHTLFDRLQHGGSAIPQYRNGVDRAKSGKQFLNQPTIPPLPQVPMPETSIDAPP